MEFNEWSGIGGVSANAADTASIDVIVVKIVFFIVVRLSGMRS